MLQPIEALIASKIGGANGKKIVLVLKIVVEHLIRRHGKELKKQLGGYTGYLKLVSWLGNAVRCAVKCVIDGDEDCKHSVDPDHGLPLDL